MSKIHRRFCLNHKWTLKYDRKHLIYISSNRKHPIKNNFLNINKIKYKACAMCMWAASICVVPNYSCRKAITA